MKKKGFTLVELLAVIAILAILVIIALPNVMSLFNEAKKNSFANELKEIYKTAQNQWMTDSMITTSDQYYSRYNNAALNCGTGTSNKNLQLSGRQQLNYAIKVDKSGNVKQFLASDNTYYFEYNATGSDSLLIEKIDGAGDSDPKVQSLSDSNATTSTISCENGTFSIVNN